jgi:pimeloyl-ACP methyl ester carboxylesterase
MRSFETRHVVVDGVHSPVLIGGAGEPGEAVVFVHGNPDAGADWKPLMERIAEFATVVAPDLPGFGGADMRADQDYTLAGYAAHLGGLIDQLGIERVHLVAHDFGGPIAMTWAAGHTDRVASVTLINTGVLIDYRWHRLAKLWRTPVLGELVMRGTSDRVARFVVRHDNPGLPTDWVDRIAGHLMPRGTKRAVLRLYRTTRRQQMHALIEPLRAANLDALVVFGDADVYIPAVQAERQRRPFPRVRIEMLRGVGHWAWLEQPDRVAEFVVPFLRERVGAEIQQPPIQGDSHEHDFGHHPGAVRHAGSEAR